MKDIMNWHIYLSLSQQIAIFLYFLYNLQLIQRFTRLCIKLQWYILNIYQNLLNRDIIISPYLQFSLQCLDKYFIHGGIFFMELQFLIIYPIQYILQIWNLG